ncbi:MAG TPA: GntR family transcriptional regulator [Pseudolabrys sp.]|nr:GntR family transcriptional regulator [Pseudolabrys sp.]
MARSPASSAAVAPPSWSADVGVIAAAFARGFEAGLPRYLQLQNAITGLIRAGDLASGAQLPPDTQLTTALGISLGTVQKALNGLAADGWLSREHGRGTFIAASRRSVTELWHYRFNDPRTGAQLPVYSRLIKRRKFSGDDVLRDKLGRDPAGYIEIERLMDIGGKFSCHSRLWLAATRFAGILELPASAVESVNLKQVFAERFGAPTLAIEQSVRALALPADIAARMGVGKRSPGMLLEALARGFARAPLSFQHIHIPATGYVLDVSPVLDFQRGAR